jgi:YbbR domain-containing protein
MTEKLKNFFLNNWQLKSLALLLAVLVWAIISGREKAYSEKTLKIPVEIINVSPNLEVVRLQPEEARVSLKGPANLIARIGPESVVIKIDLKNVNESRKLNFFAEDCLEIPKKIQIISIYPKMIEVFIEEFSAKELPVKISFHGRLKEPLKLREAKVIPDRVTIIGYKSQLGNITAVFTEEVNLDEIEASQKRKIALKQARNILKFRDRIDVDLLLEIENTQAKIK